MRKRKKRWGLGSLCAVLVLIVTVVFYFAQKQEGNYLLTVYLDEENLHKKGIDISETWDFRYVGSRLDSGRLTSDLVTTESAVFDEICKNLEGTWDQDGYMAYTFYLRNAGWEDSNYQATLQVNSIFRHAEPALRVKVWHNDEPVLCTMKEQKDEPIYRHREAQFRQGYVEKYTVDVWLEKNDPHFREDMKEAKPQLLMKIDPLAG